MEEVYKNKIVNYLKKSKVSILIIVIFTLFAFGQRLISGAFSIDTEIHINQLGTSVNDIWWTQLGRWGLVLLNKFTQMNTLPIFTQNFLTIFIMIMYSIAFNYLFYTLINDKYKNIFLKYQFIFPIIFITNPIFAEQYNFILQNVSVALSIFMIPITILIIHKAMDEKNKVKKLFFYIVSIIIASICFGVYQSIILLYIATVVVCYLLKVLNENDNNWKYLFTQILIFLIVAIVYSIISKILGQGNYYLQSAWGESGIKQCLKNIFYCVKNVLYCDTIFYNIGYVISIFGVIGIVGYLAIKKRLKIGIIIALIGLMAAPFYINVVTGVDQLKRTQFNYPFVIGIVMTLLIMFLAEKEKLKYITKLGLIFVIGLAYMQAYTTSSLFYTADITYKSDESFAHNLVENIYEKSWYKENEEYTIIFVGEHLQNLKNAYLKSEIIGRSFFEFDYQYIYGVNQGATAFLEILGYKFKMATAEEFENAKKYVEENNVPIYPKEDAIQLVDNDKIIVRLSDEY